jgi:ketosteroid isomerase-like protein
VDLARRNWELASQGTDDEIVRTFAPDVEWHHNVGLGTPLESVYPGREEVLKLLAAVRESFGVVGFEVEEVRDVSGTEVLTLGRLLVEGRGSGAAVSTFFGAITEVVDGLAVRQRFWTDQGKALGAVGLRDRRDSLSTR